MRAHSSVILVKELSHVSKLNVSYLKPREWENPQTKEIKYFNSIQGWRIELLENSNSDDDLPPLDNLSPFEPASETNDEDLDDLPF